MDDDRPSDNAHRADVMALVVPANNIVAIFLGDDMITPDRDDNETMLLAAKILILHAASDDTGHLPPDWHMGVMDDVGVFVNSFVD